MNRVPVRALAFINRLLDHGARVRIQKLSDLGSGNMFRSGATDRRAGLLSVGIGVAGHRTVSLRRGRRLVVLVQRRDRRPVPLYDALLAVERFAIMCTPWESIFGHLWRGS